jgi:hypothetical protein
VAETDVTISLAIPHTPWIPARVRSFSRLMGQIGTLTSHDVEYQIFREREPNWSWSGKMWQWGAESGATHFLSLQDDAIVAPNFWPVLRAMLAAVPDEIIGLESVHPASEQIKGSWYKTSDGLIGVGYVMPRYVLVKFLEWRSCCLCKGAIESITEDTLIDVFAVATGRKIWHPVPTIIDHDTEIASSYGNDHHSHRRPLVTWKERATDGDWTPGDVPHAGHFYAGNVARLARRWVIGATDEDWERWAKT